MKHFAILSFLTFCVLLGGCADRPRLPDAQLILSTVATAPRRPMELPEGEKQLVLKTLEGSRSGGAKAFSDPELDAQVWASFWRSPINMQIDRDRLLLVRYFEDGTYVYVGFGRDGRLFTDGVGALLSDPPWSQ